MLWLLLLFLFVCASCALLLGVCRTIVVVVVVVVVDGDVASVIVFLIWNTLCFIASWGVYCKQGVCFALSWVHGVFAVRNILLFFISFFFLGVTIVTPYAGIANSAKEIVPRQDILLY